MNANELRIGNYYDQKGEIKTVTPNTILEVWEAERIWCKAIPITEEWLLRFGFEKDDIFDKFFRYLPLHEMCTDKLSFRVSEGFICYDGIKYRTLLKHIKYTHQLQNLYFALTGEELVVSNIVNENLQQNTVSSLNCPTCNGDSWMQNLIQSEKKYCKCGAIF